MVNDYLGSSFGCKKRHALHSMLATDVNHGTDRVSLFQLVGLGDSAVKMPTGNFEIQCHET